MFTGLVDDSHFLVFNQFIDEVEFNVNVFNPFVVFSVLHRYAIVL